MTVLLFALTSPLAAQDANTPGASAPPVNVAIMDFESQAPGNPDLGRQIGDILTARLSIYPQFQLVERKKLADIIQEQSLNRSGVIDNSQATQIGRLLSARIMIFGRAFAVDRDLYIAAKIVGTETSQVKGVLAKGKLESNLSDILDQLVDQLVTGLTTWAADLLPKDMPFADPIPTLRQQLKAMDHLPTVALLIKEQHTRKPLPDPAARNEMLKVFKDVGLEILEINPKILAQWSKDLSTAGVDLMITGEGLSEYAAQIGSLVSCTARLEVQATYKESHRILASVNTTHRAIDLSEGIAAKTALQGAGRKLAIDIVTAIAADLNQETNH